MPTRTRTLRFSHNIPHHSAIGSLCYSKIVGPPCHIPAELRLCPPPSLSLLAAAAIRGETQTDTVTECVRGPVIKHLLEVKRHPVLYVVSRTTGQTNILPGLGARSIRSWHAMWMNRLHARLTVSVSGSRLTRLNLNRSSQLNLLLVVMVHLQVLRTNGGLESCTNRLRAPAQDLLQSLLLVWAFIRLNKF